MYRFVSPKSLAPISVTIYLRIDTDSYQTNKRFLGQLYSNIYIPVNIKPFLFFHYKFKPQFLFRSFFCVCFRITVLVFCDAYQPLKGHAGISTPPTSRQRQETAGNAYHFNPSSSNHGYLNTDNDIVGRSFKLITSGGGSDRKQNSF